MRTFIETAPRTRSYGEMLIAGDVRAPHEICGIARSEYYDWLSQICGEKVPVPTDLLKLISAPHHAAPKPNKAPEYLVPVSVAEKLAKAAKKKSRAATAAKPKSVPKSIQLRDSYLPKVIELNKMGKSQTEIGRELNLPQSTVSLWLKKYVPGYVKLPRGERSTGDKFVFEIIQLNKSGLTQDQIATTLGICRHAVMRTLQKHVGADTIKQKPGPKRNA